MTPLQGLLIRRIRAGGPISVASYMGDCLMHPTHGYYATRDPFGQAGDFTTAPEISQMFGEMIGLWLAQVWVDRGRPVPFALAELGPGRGTLMSDILRSAGKLAGFVEAAEVHLVETSPTLRALQQDTIAHPVTHHDSADTLPDMPLFCVANEFFDALPIRQFQKRRGVWHERLVGVEGDALAFGLSAPLIPPFGTSREEVDEGGIVETCPQAAQVMAALEARISAFGGVALVIDYGHWRSLGDTLQALRAHHFDPPLAHPGEADLTAHVDFAALAAAAPALETSAMTDQGVFLERLGITARAQHLAKSLTGEALNQHIAAHRRLTHPQEMGNLFKVLGLSQRGAPPLPGTDPL